MSNLAHLKEILPLSILSMKTCRKDNEVIHWNQGRTQLQSYLKDLAELH